LEMRNARYTAFAVFVPGRRKAGIFAKMVPFTNQSTGGALTVPGKTRKQQLQEMLADEPNDPFLRYGLAMEFVSEGNDDQALRCFHQLLEMAPDYVPAYLQAAQALMRLGRSQEAGALFERGIAAARKQGDFHAAQEMEGFLAGLG